MVIIANDRGVVPDSNLREFGLKDIISNVVATEELSGLLSRLYRSALQSNRPLVVIIDKNSLQENPRYPLQPSSLLATSHEKDDEVIPSVYLLQSENSPPQKRGPRKYELTKNRYNRRPIYKHKSHLHRYRSNYGLRAFTNKTPSPVIKTLLRFKNEINCEANDECQDQCKELTNGKNSENCMEKCEEKFECEPESDNSCDGESEDCGNKSKDTSTRFYGPVTDKPRCLRC
ncbi:unnamed protein product [Parnassius apollo]|uniref:(apollo) hypothetical protein n=1 Tax=Parnassius apollo TaxID=110799 RepID=A0A8S3X350_PARAO|nr:unnamed protein product [Parnassius apollo]